MAPRATARAKPPDQPEDPGWFVKHRRAVGLLMMASGATLGLALKHDTAIDNAVRLRPFGWVLVGTGALILIWDLWSTRRPRAADQGEDDRPPKGTPGTRSTVQNVGGLIAVGIGVIGVTAIAIVLLTTVSELAKESVVAIATSAFGVIATVVGAFVGIKIGTDQADKATEQAGKAAGEASDAKATAAAVAARTELSEAQIKQAKKKGAAATEDPTK